MGFIIHPGRGPEYLLGAALPPTVRQVQSMAGVIWSGDGIERFGLEIKTDLSIIIDDGKTEGVAIPFSALRGKMPLFKHPVYHRQAFTHIIQQHAVLIPDEMFIV